MNTYYFVGVDLGQCRDFTAIAVVERAELLGDWEPVGYSRKTSVGLSVRFLERLELGTSYPDAVERVARLTRSRELVGRCHLVVDGTGVGRPVVDLLRRARLGCGMTPVSITSGQQESSSELYRGVPKRDLIVGLQVLLQQGELKVAAGLKYGAALAAEMAAMEVRVSGAGREQFGTWREGMHDDLVLAVALACWGSRRVFGGGGGVVGEVGQRLPGI